MLASFISYHCVLHKQNTDDDFCLTQNTYYACDTVLRPIHVYTYYLDTMYTRVHRKTKITIFHKY